MKLEDLNTVHALTQEIKRLREGEEGGHLPELKLTAGQLWGRLLDLPAVRRIEMLRSLLESADAGTRCDMEAHKADLDDRYRTVVELSRELQQWNTARRLITAFTGTLREKEGSVDRAETAEELERFLAPGDDLAEASILCGYSWTEGGQHFECAEPVGPDGTHMGDHAAYVRKGFSADSGLRMRYLEEENAEMRRRLGLMRG